MNHPYEPCTHPGRHGYDHDLCDRCREVEQHRVHCLATMPMNWTTTDTYRCETHRNGRHVAYPGTTTEGTVHGGAEWPLDR